MLGNQCSLWPDPIAAAVYVPLLLGRILSHEDKALNGSDIGEAAERLGAFHARMEAEGEAAEGGRGVVGAAPQAAGYLTASGAGPATTSQTVDASVGSEAAHRLPHSLPLCASGACTLDLELVTEDFDDKEEAGLYPFNAARNRALMLARTEASRGGSGVLPAGWGGVGSAVAVLQREAHAQPTGRASCNQAVELGRELGLEALLSALCRAHARRC